MDAERSARVLRLGRLLADMAWDQLEAAVAGADPDTHAAARIVRDAAEDQTRALRTALAEAAHGAWDELFDAAEAGGAPGFAERWAKQVARTAVRRVARGICEGLEVGRDG